jgi:hypothetical protein
MMSTSNVISMFFASSLLNFVLLYPASLHALTFIKIDTKPVLNWTPFVGIYEILFTNYGVVTNLAR